MPKRNPTTIIFSDTHLTNKFNYRKFIFLKNIIESADRVIINGDFWDGYYLTFDQFLQSKWAELFPLLKQKKTVYIHGNHDTALMCDSRTNLFSEKTAEFLDLKVGKYDLHIEHGNRLSPEFSARHPWFKKHMNVLKAMILVENLAEYLMLKTIRNSMFKSANKEMKEQKDKFCREEQYLVCGHSHRHEFSVAEKYINTGANKFILGKFLVVTAETIELEAAYW